MILPVVVNTMKGLSYGGVGKSSLVTTNFSEFFIVVLQFRQRSNYFLSI